jgi:hypothetical protein
VSRWAKPRQLNNTSNGSKKLFVMKRPLGISPA